MRKSNPPALRQLLQVAKSFTAFSQELAQRSHLTSRAVLCDWPLTQQAGFAARHPVSLRPFSALPAVEQAGSDWFEDAPDAAGVAEPRTGPAQEPSAAHYQLWAQLSNLRDQGVLIQAERQDRGRPATAYPFAPISAYLDSLHGKRDKGQFDDTVLDLWARQVQQEMKAGQDAFNAYMDETRDQNKKGTGSAVSSMRRFLSRWHPQLVAATEKEQEEVSTTHYEVCKYYQGISKAHEKVLQNLIVHP